MSISGPDASKSVSAVIAGLRAAGETGDADAVADLLAPDVVFHSPFTTRIRFEDRDEVVALHRDIFAVLENLHTEPLDPDTGVFSFRARVRGVELETMALVRVNEQGQIEDYKVFVRPLPGFATLFATLPPRVSARRRGSVRGGLAAILTRPLALVLRLADRFTPKFL